MQLFFLLLILALVHICVAPAVSNPPPSFAIGEATTTALDATGSVCDSINNCRTLVSIVTSCLGTIFACVWVAVHPNIPGPTQSWLSRQVESLKVVVVTLLAPEWVLAWAVRQFLTARKYAVMLEDARKTAMEEYAAQMAAKKSNNATSDTMKSLATSEEAETDQADFGEEASLIHGDPVNMDAANTVDEGRPAGDQSSPINTPNVNNLDPKDNERMSLCESRSLRMPHL